MHWVELPDGTLKEVDMVTYAGYYSGHTKRIVAKTEMYGVRVSTVFLGVDLAHIRGGPPILFETMVFGVGEENQWRYSTRAEALLGHRAVCLEMLGVDPFPEPPAPPPPQTTTRMRLLLDDE